MNLKRHNINVNFTVLFKCMAGPYKNLVVDRVDNITTIGINRPEKRNCVNLETARELQEAFKTFENDSTTTAAVLYGKGGNFSAGLDLKEISEFSNDFNFLETGNYTPKSQDGVGPMVNFFNSNFDSYGLPFFKTLFMHGRFLLIRRDLLEEYLLSL